MKKIWMVVVLVCATFSANSFAADFCEVIYQIVDDAPNKFRNTNVTLPNAIKCRTRKTDNGNYEYSCEWENAGGESALNSFVGSVKQCFPSIAPDHRNRSSSSRQSYVWYLAGTTRYPNVRVTYSPRRDRLRFEVNSD